MLRKITLIWKVGKQAGLSVINVINGTKCWVQITNPGSLWTSGKLQKIIKDQNPPRRNPWLYQRLLLIDQKQRFLKSGLGLQRMKEAFEEVEKVKVVNIPSKNLFKVILPGKTFF